MLTVDLATVLVLKLNCLPTQALTSSSMTASFSGACSSALRDQMVAEFWSLSRSGCLVVLQSGELIFGESFTTFVASSCRAVGSLMFCTKLAKNVR